MLKPFGASRTWGLVAGILAVASSLSPSPVFAAQELRIGFVAPTTGPFSQVGKDMVNGFQMYLDEVKGNFAGAKVVFIVEVDDAKPPVAVRRTCSTVSVTISAPNFLACSVIFCASSHPLMLSNPM